MSAPSFCLWGLHLALNGLSHTLFLYLRREPISLSMTKGRKGRPRKNQRPYLITHRNLSSVHSSLISRNSEVIHSTSNREMTRVFSNLVDSRSNLVSGIWSIQHSLNQIVDPNFTFENPSGLISLNYTMDPNSAPTDPTCLSSANHYPQKFGSILILPNSRMVVINYILFNQKGNMTF